jgi:hypothetical protein
MATKTKLIKKAKALSEEGLEKLGRYLPGQSAFDRLQNRTQDEILRLLTLTPP